jgi:hypothetical protein
MRKLILFASLFVPACLFGGGPAYHQKDSSSQLEFENAYQDIREAKSFSLSKSSATSTYLSLSSAGATYEPSHSASMTRFLVTNSSVQNDVTGDGTQPVVQFNTEVLDGITGHFASNTFTATVTGAYHFDACVFMKGFLTGHTSMAVLIVTSNRNYQNIDNSIDTATNKGLCISVLADMEVGDTADVRVRVSGSTKVIDIDNSVEDVFFSGFLLQ